MRIDLFGPRPSKPRQVRMQAIDTGQAPGLMPGWRTSMGGHFRCQRCGHDDGWSFDMMPSEIRRGLPCPVCNSMEAANANTR